MKFKKNIMNKQEEVEKSTKKAIALRIQKLKDSAINRFELPFVDKSEILFINCKYYNLLI